LSARIIIIIIIAYYYCCNGDIHLARQIHFIFHSTIAQKKPIRTEPNGLNQQRQKAKGWAHTKGRQCGRYFWLPLLVILCIILIFIYILSILHNARVTTEIVGWQFINT